MKFAQDLSILNVMERIVIHMFEDNYLKTQTLKCDCDKCQLDIVLLTLNHLTPHYTSSQVGEAYIKASYLNHQLRSDILKELIQSVMIIEEHPNH
jgi:competence protein ComFB